MTVVDIIIISTGRRMSPRNHVLRQRVRNVGFPKLLEKSKILQYHINKEMEILVKSTHETKDLFNMVDIITR